MHLLLLLIKKNHVYSYHLLTGEQTILPKPVICLMGPTASGKTALAVSLVQQFPCDIISVDSAMVYRGLDIGTAKPDREMLRIAPHRLIDILDPAEPYSAGRFRFDALREINNVLSQGRVPLLVGGTMLYFRVLQQGLASLPEANKQIRARLKVDAERKGWEALHGSLAKVDPAAAERIHPRDAQRIQRALEVYWLTGKSMTAGQKNTDALADYRILNLGLFPSERAWLYERIALRFDHMLAAGFEEEVRGLLQRGDLNPDLPSMRSVGYRQMWDYLTGPVSFDDMQEKAIAATRQLAKRQLTWLRSWPAMVRLNADAVDVGGQAADWLDRQL